MKQKVLVRATLDLGDYLFDCVAPAIEELGYTPVRLGTRNLYPIRGMPVHKIMDSQARELSLILNHVLDDKDVFCLINFTDWAYRSPIAMLEAKQALPIPIVFWSREDDYHYGRFNPDARQADIICTSERSCIEKYKMDFPTAIPICTPMALAPSIFTPPDSNDEREWDVVFVGNRYKGRETRELGEDLVLLPALRWCKENNKKMGLWGKGPDSADLFSWANQKEVWESGIYQRETTRLEAAEIYRKAKVVLSYTSCPDGETMLPNRILQAVGCGCIILSQKTDATDEILDNNYWKVSEKEDVGHHLEDIFFDLDKSFDFANRCRNHVLANHTFKHRLDDIFNLINATGDDPVRSKG